MLTNGCTFIASSLNNLSFGYDFESPKCISLLTQLRGRILNLYKEGVRDFYSVCEQGVDLWAAEEVTRLTEKDNSVKLHCYLPYEEQAAKWPSDLREIYYNVLEKADSVKFISVHYFDGCMRKARYCALDKCKYVISAEEIGENAEYLYYALRCGKEILDCEGA